MRFVSRQERPVPAGVIVDHLELTRPTVSHHLKILTIHRAVATAGPGTVLALPPRAYLNRYGYVIAVGEDPEQVTADLAGPSALIEL